MCILLQSHVFGPFLTRKTSNWKYTFDLRGEQGVDHVPLVAHLTISYIVKWKKGSRVALVLFIIYRYDKEYTFIQSYALKPKCSVLFLISWHIHISCII